MNKKDYLKGLSDGLLFQGILFFGFMIGSNFILSPNYTVLAWILVLTYLFMLVAGIGLLIYVKRLK